ncbi:MULTISPECIES: SAF domain-containing protein [Janibacter]|uniref:SAF domain-containing protein n=1 Tax=Janibacter indicus TaxID=857417 RepID=A0A1L3MKA7_9MICO|nr:SAF domain-containing protein [Janibacter indicus]APH02634.1 hypothetical protein ASJ30_14700 [Janibacter indicus]QOK22607.1 hypothetical protein IGS73_16345 [Janibacter indicus]SMC37183.1 SAF domain-containing protein [Janibacter indicus]
MTAPTAEPPPAEQATRRNRNGDGNTAEGAAAPEPPKLRRRPMLIAVSVLLTALGALLGAFLLSTLSGTDDYVAVRADIERGDVIKETDLVRTQLRRDNSISPLSWDEQRSLIGMYANVDMAKGSLVTRESVSAEIAPADGWSIVGLALTPGQGVTGDLRVGQPIEAVVVPASAEAITGRPTTYEGIVSSVDMSDDGQTKLVDVQVRTDDASPLAAAAARQEVAIVVKSKGNGSGDTAAEPSDSTSDTTPSASPTS